MTRLLVCGWSLVCALSWSYPAFAQDGDRIWGRVHTTSGEVHEGFIRWDRNEGSWVDVLDGAKALPEENYQVWLAANDEEPAVRSIELMGYLVSWDEEHPDFPSTTSAGIRFGHLESLAVLGPDRVQLALRSGRMVELSRRATDIGPSIRDLTVDVPGFEEVELRWRDLDRVVFSAAPPAARARSRRLFGTVEDVRGRVFSGYVSWDLDEILESDVLDGDEMTGGDEREIRFGDISAIERIAGGSRVTLTSGAVVDLTGSNDVDDGHRGVQISDSDLGMIEVEWEQFRALRLHRPGRVTGYDSFDGGRPLVGTVTTQSGDELYGMIRWDADEEQSWELLNGRDHDVVFAVELSFVDRIERGEALGVTVWLTDGRTLELSETTDVDWDSKGVFIAEVDADPAQVASWRVVSWDDFKEIQFERAASGVAPGPGS